MKKIIRIEEDNIHVGSDNGETLEFKSSQFNFTPSIGDVVEVFGSEDSAMVSLVNNSEEPAKDGSSLMLVAFILNVISTVACGWTIIPLAWMIPMTVHTWQVYKGKKQGTTAFGVCTLLFLNTIAGILILVDND